MRVAAIDIGTNSVLLLVADARGGVVDAVVERATITRLGQGVDRERALAKDAVERTLACLASYAETLRELGVAPAHLDVVGTSAMRDARGGAAFVARAAELLRVAPRVIAGDEEAALTFEGALSGIALAEDAPVTVFDVGGGSTEVVCRRGRGAALEVVSLDIGSVRLTERHVRADPPDEAELAAVRLDARAALATAPLGPPGGALVGVAGTVTTLAAHALGVAPYDGARVHGARLPAAAVERAAAELAALPLAGRRALPAVDEKRADVIVAGSIIVVEALRRSGAIELVVSDRGVRWGLAQRIAQTL